jgi:hypothetical protein
MAFRDVTALVAAGEEPYLPGLWRNWARTTAPGDQLHHCDSQGLPSLSPSICVLGQ